MYEHSEPKFNGVRQATGGLKHITGVELDVKTYHWSRARW